MGAPYDLSAVSVHGYGRAAGRGDDDRPPPIPELRVSKSPKPKWHTRWKVLPHDPVLTLEDNLRTVEAALPKMSLRRRMTIIRLADGRLVIHNAIALDDASMAALEAWGKPAFLIVPNHFHRLDAVPFKQRYPDLVVIADPRSKGGVEAALPIDGGPELLPKDPTLTCEPLDGCKIGEMAFVIRHGSRATLLLNDALFNQPHLPGFSGFIMRAIGSTGALKVTRIMRLFGVKDLGALKAHLVRLAETPGLARLIVSHGHVIEGAEVGPKIRAAVA
jgi:hypothetical protein